MLSIVFFALDTDYLRGHSLKLSQSHYDKICMRRFFSQRVIVICMGITMICVLRTQPLLAHNRNGTLFTCSATTECAVDAQQDTNNDALRRTLELHHGCREERGGKINKVLEAFFFSFAHPFSDVAALTDLPCIRRSSAVRPTLPRS